MSSEPMYEREIDPETGFKIDSDTGEHTRNITTAVNRPCYGDSETGERNQNLHAIPRHVFKVPRAVLKLDKDCISTAMCETPRNTSTNPLAHNVNITLFILPMLVFLPGWFALMYVLGEGMFHLWAHKNNYTRYKSPLDPVFDQVCAICSFERSMEKVGKLQDERLIQVTTRRLLDYDYVKKIGIGT